MIFQDWKEAALYTMRKVNFLLSSSKKSAFLTFLRPGSSCFICLRLGPESFGSRGALISESQSAKTVNYLHRAGLEHRPLYRSITVIFLTTAVQRYSEAWNAAVLPEKVD